MVEKDNGFIVKDYGFFFVLMMKDDQVLVTASRRELANKLKNSMDYHVYMRCSIAEKYSHVLKWLNINKLSDRALYRKLKRLELGMGLLGYEKRQQLLCLGAMIASYRAIKNSEGKLFNDLKGGLIGEIDSDNTNKLCLVSGAIYSNIEGNDTNKNYYGCVSNTYKVIPDSAIMEVMSDKEKLEYIVLNEGTPRQMRKARVKKWVYVVRMIKQEIALIKS